MKKRKFVKNIDAWWTKLVIDNIAIPIVEFLSKYDFITPNKITIVSIILAILSSLFILTTNTYLVVLGAILYQISFIFDCVDGKLARLKKMSSTLGELLDNIGDRISILLLSFSVGYYFYVIYGNIKLILLYLIYAYITVVNSNVWLIYEKYRIKFGLKEDNINLLQKNISSIKILNLLVRFFKDRGLRPYPSEIEFNLVLFTILPIITALFSNKIRMISEFVVFFVVILMIMLFLAQFMFVVRNIKRGGC